MKKYPMCFFGPIFLALLLFHSACFAAGNKKRQADLAWSENDGNRYEIYHAHFQNGSWGEKIQITNNTYDNMHPDMAVDRRGQTMLVWTALEGVNNKLFYSVEQGKSWSFPKELETGLQSSIGPALVADTNGRIWVAWAGYNGVADDIYVSHWNGTEWSTPVQVNPENTVPDILPEISVNDNGKLQVVWKGYDGVMYQQYRSIQQKSGWTSPEILSGSEIVSKEGKSKAIKFQENDLPLPEDFHPIRDDDRLYKLMLR